MHTGILMSFFAILKFPHLKNYENLENTFLNKKESIEVK